MWLIAADPGRTARKRRYLNPRVLAMLRPLFRHSPSREAYVLRLVGNRVGPVLKPSYRDPQPPR
jgi:hypothetical protein